MTQDFTSHLEELRRRLVFTLVFFFGAVLICYFFSKTILDFLTEPLREHSTASLYFQTPYEAFLVHLKAAALAGFVLTLPVLTLQAWLFISPGLYAKERRTVIALTAAGVLLFLLGALFSFKLVIPWSLQFLLGFETQNLKPMLAIGPYFSFLSGMLLAFGAVFNFPVVMIGLVRLGVVNAGQLARSRKIVVVGIVVLAAALTPSPDPFSQLMLALPLYLLYEASLFLARLFDKPGLTKA